MARKEASRKLNLADEIARMDALGIRHERFESRPPNKTFLRTLILSSASR
jgi:hypothetical protein